MSPKSKEELSYEDIKFLKSIDKIEGNPDAVPDTALTEVPANTSSIGHVCDLPKHQIKYRTRPADHSNGRGLDELGYLRTYEPEMIEGKIGPRSVELTDQGRKAIISWEKRNSDVNDFDWDGTTVEEIEIQIAKLQSSINDLETRMADTHRESGQSAGGESEESEEDVAEEFDRVNSRLDAISESVKTFKQREWGAVSEDRVAEYERVREMAMAMGTLFEALGVDKPFRARKEGFDTAEAVQQIQSRLDVQGDEVTETVADDGSSGEGLGDDTDGSTGESDNPFDAVPDE